MVGYYEGVEKAQDQASDDRKELTRLRAENDRLRTLLREAMPVLELPKHPTRGNVIIAYSNETRARYADLSDRIMTALVGWTGG